MEGGAPRDLSGKKQIWRSGPSNWAGCLLTLAAAGGGLQAGPEGDQEVFGQPSGFFDWLVFLSVALISEQTVSPRAGLRLCFFDGLV